VVISANPGCMIQLQANLKAAGSRARVRHVVELLDEAYQAAPRHYEELPVASGSAGLTSRRDAERAKGSGQK
jgi:hypothetical protein